MRNKGLVLGHALAAILFAGGVSASAADQDFDQGVAAPRVVLEGSRDSAAAMPNVAAASAPTFVDQDRVAHIWPEIVFARGADYAEFAYTMSQNRDMVRKMMLKEFGDLLIPMAGANADVNELAKTILGAIITFDGMHSRHKDEAVQGLQVSFENNLRAEMDKLFSGNRLKDSSRRVEFLPRDAAAYWGVKSHASDQDLAKKVLENVDFLIHGSYTLLGGSRIQVTLTLEKLVGGNSRSFSATAPIDAVIPILARQLFDFFQANEYRDWVDPQPSLEWIPSAATQPKATATEAKLYCRGQGARLPYSRELILASQGGQYRRGGIAPLADDGAYIVADKQHHDEQHYFFTDSSADATGGPVRTSAGYGVIRGYYWCVRGEPSAEVKFYESLYRIRRQTADPEVSRALECLLLKLDDFGARQWECRDAYPSAEAAQEFLGRKGYFIQLP